MSSQNESKSDDEYDLFDGLNLAAMLAGMGFIAMLAAGGIYIQAESSKPPSLQTYKPLFVSYLIGVSTGHYLAKPSISEKHSIRSAYLGAFLMLSMYWAYLQQISILTAVLIMSTVTLVLGHHSNLVDEHKQIRKLIKLFAQGLSPVGLTLVVVFQYAIPTLPAEVMIGGRTVDLIPLYGLITIMVVFVALALLYVIIKFYLDERLEREIEASRSR